MTDNPSHDHPPRRADQLPPFGDLEMRSQRDGDVHIITLAGEIDLANADDVEQELLRVEATDARIIRVDLSGLTFIDSTAIRLLVLASARASADGNRLSLHNPSDRVLRVLHIAGIAARLPISN